VGEAVERSILDSGLRVVTEALPGLRSVAVGFWVGTGSRDETDQISGASHFLEHLLFKGTARRGALEIANSVESVGGDMNAFTTHEATVFYVRVPDERIYEALDILSDIVWSPSLRGEDVDAERQVILEEIRMHDDSPEDLVHDVFAQAIFPDHAIGRTVIGIPETINSLGPKEIGDFHSAHYHPSNVVVAAAGNLNHDEVVKQVEAALLPDTSRQRPEREVWTGGTAPKRLAVVERDSEQAHVVLGMRALRGDDPDRYAFAVLNQVLGGGMSSRLFQEVREKRGLAYSVYAYRSAFDETGTFAISAGTAPDRLPELLEVIGTEIDRVIVDGGVGDDELMAAKGHLTGSLALSLETSGSRMHRIGSNELSLGEIATLDELVDRVNAVGPGDISRVVERVMAPPERSLAVVGPVKTAEVKALFN